MAGHGKEKIRKGTAAANLQNEVLLAVFGSEDLSVLIFQGAELLAGWCRGERLETSQLGIFFRFFEHGSIKTQDTEMKTVLFDF